MRLLLKAAIVIALVVSAAVLLRLHAAAGAQRVNVRYADGASVSDRLTIEKAFGLTEGIEQESRTWSYLLRNQTRSNIQALVSHPLVQDTSHLDRARFRVVLDRPGVPAILRGLAEAGWLSWMAGALALCGGAMAWRMRRDAALALQGPLEIVRAVAIAGPRFVWGTRAPAPSMATASRGGLASVLSALALGAAMAALVTLMGPNDVENYDDSFFSLDRGTNVETIKTLGNPVYTLALGLGVRLPLLGSLSASPAAALAPYLSDPWTYWLLLTLAIASAALLVRYALEPLGGRLVFWIAAFLLFVSLPIVNYTITNDWLDDAVSYCSFISCVFAPHALLVAADSSLATRRRLLRSLGLLGLVWGAIALSYPGYWPLIGLTLIVSAALASIRVDYTLRTRVIMIAILGVTSMVAIGLLASDVLREMWTAGDMLSEMERPTRAPIAGLLTSNWPWPLPASFRAPFTFLLMTITSLVIGFRWWDTGRRRLLLGSGLAALTFGFSAAHLSSESSGKAVFIPVTMWALRDPAIGFAVLGAACAARVLHANRSRHAIEVRCMAVLLVVCGLMGPFVAVARTFRSNDLAELFDAFVGPRGTMPPQLRMAARGLHPEQVAAGSRIALWPGVYREMRNRDLEQADFADAGYVLVTAAVKQRTMKQVVDGGHDIDNNDVLFEQSTFLPGDVLCDPSAAQLLQLNYLLAPAGTNCGGWHAVAPPLVVDGWLTVFKADESDSRVRALPSGAVSGTVPRQAALAPHSSLLAALTPLPGTSVALGPHDVVVRQDNPSLSRGLMLILPVAYDSAWKASSGRIEDIGGLVALTAVTEPRVVLSFEPDTVAVLHSAGMTLAQLFTCLGFIALAWIVPAGKSRAVPDLSRSQV